MKKYYFIHAEDVPEEMTFDEMTDEQIIEIVKNDDLRTFEFESFDDYIWAFNTEDCPDSSWWYGRAIDTEELLNKRLTSHYSMFHSDLITRAMTDDSISKEQLVEGILDIIDKSEDDNDEYTPSVFVNV